MSTKLKSCLAAAGALVLAIFIGLGIYGSAQHRAYLESKGKAEALTQQYRDYELIAKKAIVDLTIESANWKAAQEAALAAAESAGKQTAIITAALEAEKARTKTLPPDILAGNINLRIGPNECLPVANGSFSLTRYGVENTLNIFLDGEGYNEKLKAESLVSENLRSAYSSSQHENDTLGQRLSIRETELSNCIALKDATSDTLKHLERAQFGLKVKTIVITAGVTYASVKLLPKLIAWIISILK
jgi:hypothetical protein